MKLLISKIRQLIKLFLKRLPILFANIITLIFTVIIFSNSMEIIFEVDIPYAYSVKAFTGSNYLNDSNYYSLTANQQNKLTANYGNPKIIKFPSINKKLELMNPIVKDGKYLVRTNKAHQILDQKGNIVIYLLKSWQTIDNLQEISEGNNVFLDSDKGWRYVYRIDEVSQMSVNSNIVMPNSENPQLLIIVEDRKNLTNYIFRGQYLTVINVQK